MNTPKKWIYGLLICLVLLSLSCGLSTPGKVVKDVATEYETLITAYQNGRRAAANGNTCVALAFSEIQNQTVLYNSYLTSDIAKAEAYRKALATYGGKISDAGKAYVDENGQPISISKLDLGQLAQQGATPAQMALNVNAYVTQFQEAPLERVDVTALTNTQRLVSEKYNLVFACVKDWNDAIFTYNEERNKIKGDVVGSIADYLGVKELPEELPYFMMQAPAAPPTVPTVSVP